MNNRCNETALEKQPIGLPFLAMDNLRSALLWLRLSEIERRPAVRRHNILSAGVRLGWALRKYMDMEATR